MNDLLYFDLVILLDLKGQVRTRYVINIDFLVALVLKLNFCKWQNICGEKYFYMTDLKCHKLNCKKMYYLIHY